jgi:N-acetylglutamate synthase-like GNAT family acetyltransferase
MDLVVERAISADRESLAALLEAYGLSSHEILAPSTLYWVCRLESVVVGTCGMEVGNGVALLRSVCVIENQRGKNIAERLVDSALTEAGRLGLWDIYLFSKDTGAYFERLGWRRVSIAEVVARLPEAPQVRRYEQAGWYPDERAFLRKIKI